MLDSLEISPSNITILKGDTYQLLVNFVPSNANNKNVVWESNNPSIATVENGVINAIKTGTTNIKATSNGISSEIEVVVKDNIIDVESVNIQESSINLVEGDRATLKTSYSPSNATNKSFIFTSSNENVAIVNNNGVVTAVSYGNATITMTSVNGKKDSVKISVTRKTTNDIQGESSANKITSIIMSLENVSMQIGETKKIRATILPLNANQEVIWVSNNPEIVSVVDGLLTAHKNGSTTISAIATNGMIANTKVTISYPPIFDSGEKLVELTSNTLIVSMTQDPKSKINIIRIWASDPYNQFHKISANPSETISEIMNNSIAKLNFQNSILVGGNASFSKTTSYYSVGNLNITEGNILLNNPGGDNSKDFGNTLFYAGINSNGDLKVYCTNPKNNCGGGSVKVADESKLFSNIINDGVKSTISMSFENLLVVNGRKVNDPGWMDRYAIRHTFCQVNKNNFVMTISSNGDKVDEVASLQESLGCQVGINLDGGGSANSFYKRKGSNNITMIKSTDRRRPEAIFFAEY